MDSRFRGNVGSRLRPTRAKEKNLMSEEAIRVDGVSYAYGDVKAVDDVSFSVAQGEVLGFLGPNGAGKSTTIKLLTGQMRPQSGEISILGMNVAKDRDVIQGSHRRLL